MDKSLEICSNLPGGIVSSICSAVKASNTSKEGFAEDNGYTLAITLIILFVNIVVSFFSFYFAFRCIKKGGNVLGNLLGACCCGILYIAYAIVQEC